MSKKKAAPQQLAQHCGNCKHKKAPVEGKHCGPCFWFSNWQEPGRRKDVERAAV
jgi:hypothetical protein